MTHIASPLSQPQTDSSLSSLPGLAPHEAGAPPSSLPAPQPALSWDHSPLRPLAAALSRRQVIVEPRFEGPPEMGNGGYVSGVLAEAAGARDGSDLAVEITLRAPTPLGRSLGVGRRGEDTVLLDGETVVATARTAELELEPPLIPTLAEARRASARFLGRDHHPFPRCFVCGTGRSAGDGLRLFPGHVGEAGVVACTWIPGGHVCDPEGAATTRSVWAALDCPGAWGMFDALGMRVSVLGRITGRQLAPIDARREHIVMGWHIGSERRKHHVGSAIVSEGGEVLAVARGTWVELR